MSCNEAKTLYVSDLDGTLLGSDQRTSEFTNRVVNSLTERGVLFSYATARSGVTAVKVTAGMTTSFPTIVYNGAFILDHRTGAHLQENFFRKDEAAALIKEFTAAGIWPIVYSFVEGEEKFSYLPDKCVPAALEFTASRRGDPRDRPLADEGALGEGDVFYLSCIGETERLAPFYEKYRARYHCVFQREIYTRAQWLEIMPREASKANAARQLAALYGCERIVSFGDGLNDLDLFAVSDEAYAVENAAPELKAAATAVIPANDEDGVAVFLARRFSASLECEV